MDVQRRLAACQNRASVHLGAWLLPRRAGSTLSNGVRLSAAVVPAVNNGVDHSAATETNESGDSQRSSDQQPIKIVLARRTGNSVTERAQQDDKSEQWQADKRRQTATPFASRRAAGPVAFVHQRGLYEHLLSDGT